MNVDALRLVRVSFVAEAVEIIERLTRVIIELEAPGNVSDALHDELGRGLHTLKGTAGSIGLSDVSVVAHELESLFAPVRRKGALPAHVADELLRGLDRILELVREGGADLSLPVEDEPVAPPSETESGWRVGPQQIRGLMREVERLRNLRMRLDERRRQLASSLEPLLAAADSRTRAAIATALRGLTSDRDETSDVADEIEGGLKDIWTTPALVVLEPLQRIVRDQCRDTRKQATLSFVGAELALDRRVVEALKAPFVHLIRNAIDHGIEPPEDRRRAGKHDSGALAIRLEQQGNMLFIEVADDGAGLDHTRLLDVARARGIVSAARAEVMTEGEVAQLIFAPGFSTRDEVSETSGRGVGLDVVMTEVRALQGSIEVQSVRGQGTRFLISVPVDLGSSATLIVKSSELRFGLPIHSIESVIAVRPDQVQVGHTRMRLVTSERMLPLISLASLLGLAHPSAPTEPRSALIVQSRGERLAVLVDDIVGEAEVMVRPLPIELRRIPAYQGVATISTGELLLVIRAPWLAEASARAQQPIAVSRRALVVDDSVTARALHRAVLEAAGFVVHAASNGRQALEHLRRTAYDVAVCDLAMPEIDGLALTRELRASGHRTPVVLVSAHDTDENRAQGLAAGANAFLSKRECASGRLLAEVSRVISSQRGSG